MKERIVIEEKIAIKHLKNLEKEHDEQFMFFPEYKMEKVPETWEDLTKLVIDNCHNYTLKFDGIKNRQSIECKGFIFYKFGLVEFSITTKTIDNDFVKFNRCLATEMQPAQMWNIIKNLIGGREDNGNRNNL